MELSLKVSLRSSHLLRLEEEGTAMVKAWGKDYSSKQSEQLVKRL
jgi:hypothetical protein